jgi:cellulose synthase/poly-beta-1,6-N-acetylglucosamine synthase-like glycosyltransferase
MQNNPQIYFAIPVMDEADTLPLCISCIEKQTYSNIKVVICVNQPEAYWADSTKTSVCINNKKTLEFLDALKNETYTIIDRSSVGLGWTGKKHGVGWARKTVMDHIAAIANDEDIIVCMDADTTFDKDFIASIVEGFQSNKDAVGMALPYYHRLTGDEILDRAVLRYEIYMRYYTLNLFRIHNPYCFTAIGSSMATTVKTYKAVRGIAPKLSGEDFYFLQKLRKHGSLIVWNEESTYPATRYSERVFFGTGPALIKGSKDQWESYPLYSYQLFDTIKQTYDFFDDLFTEDIETPMTNFLESAFNTKNFWQPIRDNFKTLALFRRSCCEKVDGLRILQYLKSKQKLSDNEAEYLVEYLKLFHNELFQTHETMFQQFSFEHSPVNDLDMVRDMLCQLENNYRKQYKIIDWY